MVLTKSDPSARGYASYQEPCHTMRDQPSPLERDRGSKLVNRAWETFPNGSVDWMTIFSKNEFWGLSHQYFGTSFAQMAYPVNSYESSIYVHILIRPSQLAVLSRSEFYKELFSHSTYVKFFVTFATKVPYWTFCDASLSISISLSFSHSLSIHFPYQKLSHFVAKC